MNKIKDLMPALGFGTFGRTGDEGVAAIAYALETGYRHLDTAQSYDTEREVGRAIAGSRLRRDDVFVTTKIKPENFGPGKLIPSLEASLEALRLDAVDLTLIHWPSPRNAVPLQTYLVQLGEAKAAGLTRSIGVSNFTVALLKEAIGILGDGELLTNQIELNPTFQNRKVADFCTRNAIAVTCYQPLAQGRAGNVETLKEIARHHDASATQVALAYELARGYAAIPTSSKRKRIALNFGALDLQLSPDEIARIDAVAQASRSIDPETSPDWD